MPVKKKKKKIRELINDHHTKYSRAVSRSY